MHRNCHVDTRAKTMGCRVLMMQKYLTEKLFTAQLSISMHFSLLFTLQQSSGLGKLMSALHKNAESLVTTKAEHNGPDQVIIKR